MDTNLGTNKLHSGIAGYATTNGPAFICVLFALVLCHGAGACARLVLDSWVSRRAEALGRSRRAGTAETTAGKSGVSLFSFKVGGE